MIFGRNLCKLCMKASVVIFNCHNSKLHPYIALFDPVQLFNCLVEGKLAQTNGAAAIPSCSPSQALASRPIPHTGSPIAVTISLSQTHSY